MTEAAIFSCDDAAQLFAHEAPRPLRHVPLPRAAALRWSRRTQSLGLALSDDEIDYLVDEFQRSWSAIRPTSSS